MRRPEGLWREVPDHRVSGAFLQARYRRACLGYNCQGWTGVDDDLLCARLLACVCVFVCAAARSIAKVSRVSALELFRSLARPARLAEAAADEQPHGKATVVLEGGPFPHNAAQRSTAQQRSRDEGCWHEIALFTSRRSADPR